MANLRPSFGVCSDMTHSRRENRWTLAATIYTHRVLLERVYCGILKVFNLSASEHKQNVWQPKTVICS